MYHLATFVITILFLPLISPAQDRFDADARAKRIAPYLDDQAVAVVHADLGRIDVKAFVAQVATFTAAQVAEIAKDDFTRWLEAMKQAGATEFYAVASLADLPRAPYLILPVGKETNTEALRRLFEKNRALGAPKSPVFPAEVCEPIGDVLFAGSKAARDRLRNVKAAPQAQLARAFTAAGDTAVQIVILVSQDTRRALEDSLPALPMELGSDPVKVLTGGISWAVASADVTPKMSLRVVVQSPDADGAKKLADWSVGVLKRVGAEMEVLQVWPEFPQLIEKLQPKVEGDRLTLALDETALTAFLQPAAAKVRRAADRARDVNSLKQIGVALHNYHDGNKSFPPAANYDKNDKPLLSWRVHILPYLEQDNLYKQFKLDEPWDSEHNKKLIAKMPAVFRSSEKLEAGKTTYLGVAGDKAMFPGKKGVALREVSDGTSNTIVVVDVDEAKAVTWTKPDDYKYDPDNPAAGLTGRFDGQFSSLFGDGSVRFMSGKMDPKILTALFTRDGGEIIRHDQ
jgi:hypothetical protein